MASAEEERDKHGAFLDFPSYWIEDFRARLPCDRMDNEYTRWLQRVIDENSYLPGEWVKWSPELEKTGGVCTRCKIDKPPEDYYEGRSACKDCIRESSRRTWRKYRETYNARRSGGKDRKGAPD